MSLVSGHEAMETVYLMNDKGQAFHFSIDEDSTHSADYSTQLSVEPMAGRIPAKSPYSRFQVVLGSLLCTFMN